MDLNDEALGFSENFTMYANLRNAQYHVDNRIAPLDPMQSGSFEPVYRLQRLSRPKRQLMGNCKNHRTWRSRCLIPTERMK